jgi:phage/plasmid-associated DNA primase
MTIFGATERLRERIRAADEASARDLIPYCDEWLTLAFSERHADDLRYCDVFGRWFEWDGGRWREDITRRVFTHAREFCREQSAKARDTIKDPKVAVGIARSVASARTVAVVVNLARADLRHGTKPDDWDADPWALNTPDGIVDLRTGQMRPHDRAALCSKMTTVAPAEAHCPRWQRFSIRSPPVIRTCSAFSAASPAMASPGLPASTRCSSSTAPAPTARAPSSTR